MEEDEVSIGICGAPRHTSNYLQMLMLLQGLSPMLYSTENPVPTIKVGRSYETIQCHVCGAHRNTLRKCKEGYICTSCLEK